MNFLLYDTINKKNIKIDKLIKNINKKLKKKIKVKYLNHSKIVPSKSKLKILPNWKPMYDIQKKIKDKFI